MNKNSERELFEVYGYRWIVLVVFILAGVSNALVLLTWSPISDKASDYWNGLSVTYVNLLAVMFQVLYFPGTSLSVYAMQKTNLRYTMLLGGSLTAVGCLVRWIGAAVYDAGDTTSTGSYAVVLIGTALVALSQPFYLNMPAKIASTWFSLTERDVSTTLCSLANPLGSALGSILPAMFVSESGDDVKGVSTLLLVQLIVAVTTLGLTLLLFRNTPPTPPR
jgi:FLVCR family MFS transporter 7